MGTLMAEGGGRINGGMLRAGLMHHDFDPERFIGATPQTEHAYASCLGTQLEEASVVTLVAEREGAAIGTVTQAPRRTTTCRCAAPQACYTTWW